MNLLYSPVFGLVLALSFVRPAATAWEIGTDVDPFTDKTTIWARKDQSNMNSR